MFDPVHWHPACRGIKLVLVIQATDGHSYSLTYRCIYRVSQKKRYTFFEIGLQALFGGVALNAIHQIFRE